MKLDFQVSLTAVVSPHESVRPAVEPHLDLHFPDGVSHQAALARPHHDIEPIYRAAMPQCAPPGAPAQHQPKLRDSHFDFTQIESILESHPSVSQAIVSVCDGHLVAYVRAATVVSEIEITLPAVIDATVERIRNYDARRIFEIGCGTGQLLTRLAPDAECYWASDSSEAAIDTLETSLTLPQVRLFHRPAHDFSGLPDNGFDTVVIHSAARNFPDAATLSRTLEGAGRLLAPGGRIILADMVGNALRPVLHAAVLVPGIPAGTTVGQFRESVANRVSHDTSLALDPAWFDHLTARIAGLGPVEIQIRRETAGDGAARSRYDAILHKQPCLRLHPLPPPTAWGNLNLEQVEAILHGQQQDLYLTGIPDAHLVTELAFYRVLATAPANSPLPFAQPRPGNAASADDLTQLAAQAGFTAHVRWQGDGTSGLLEVAFIHDFPRALPAWPSVAAPLPPSSLVNHPSPTSFLAGLGRQFTTRLPRHMIPSTFVVMENFPLTPEGRIDRDALQPPDSTIQKAARTLAPAPNDTESRLLEIWKQILGRSDISITDDIFDVGGDSILIFQITTRAGRSGLVITPAQVLRLRTVSAVVAALSDPSR